MKRPILKAIKVISHSFLMSENLKYVMKVLFDFCWSLFQCLMSDINEAKEECKDFLSILFKILLSDIPFYLILGNDSNWEKHTYYQLRLVLKKMWIRLLDEVIFPPLRPIYFHLEGVYWYYYEMEMSWYVDDDWTKHRDHIYKQDLPVIKENIRDEFNTLKEYIRLLPGFIWRHLWRALRRVFFWVSLFSYRIFGNLFIIVVELLFRHVFFFVARACLICILGLIFFIFVEFIVFWAYVFISCVLFILYLFLLGTPFFFIYKLLKERPLFAARIRYWDMRINPFPAKTEKLVQFLLMIKDRYVSRRRMNKERLEQLHLAYKKREENERNARITLGLPVKESKVERKFGS